MNNTFVFDCNALISASLIKNSINAQAIDHALVMGRIVFSPKTMDEFVSVVFRKKFDRYFLDDNERMDVIKTFGSHAVFVTPAVKIEACRDVKDNKYLELAVSAQASCIITGDQDLLVLNPFENIPIVTANDFVKFSSDDFNTM